MHEVYYMHNNSNEIKSNQIKFCIVWFDALENFKWKSRRLVSQLEFVNRVHTDFLRKYVELKGTHSKMIHRLIMIYYVQFWTYHHFSYPT